MIQGRCSQYRKSSTDYLYFCGLLFYLIYSLNTETLWYSGVSAFILKLLSTVTLILHIFFTLSRYRKSKHRFIFLFTAFLSFIVGYNSGLFKGGNLIFEVVSVFLLIFGAKDIDFRKILKFYIIVSFSYCIITFLSSLVGIIENIKDYSFVSVSEYKGIERPVRMCFGYGFSTNFANHIFFIILSYSYYIARSLNKVELLSILLIDFFLLTYTGTRLSFLCILLVVFISLYVNHKKRNSVCYKKGIIYILSMCIPFFCILSYCMTIWYDESDLVWQITDIVLSNRLQLGNDAISKYGIPLLGQVYEENGTIRMDGNMYNYIDCSYIRFLVINGWIYTVFILLAYYYICYNALKRNDILFYYSILLAGVSGLIAQHFSQLFMNPFLIATFSRISPKNNLNSY